MLIVNADDLGKSHSRNLAIRQGMEKGWIDRASLIVNMDDFEDACRLFQGGGGGDVCFHLNLGEGPSMTEEIKSTYLCDSACKFIRMRNPRLHLKMAWQRSVRRAVRQEIESQMSKFRDCGFRSTHMDSHFFTHAELDVALELIPAMKKYGFRTVRTLSGHFIGNRLRTAKWITRQYYNFVQCLYERAGFVSDSWSGCPREYLSEHPISREVEVYVHPDIIDGENMDSVYSYTGEKQLLSLVRQNLMHIR